MRRCSAEALPAAWRALPAALIAWLCLLPAAAVGATTDRERDALRTSQAAIGRAVGDWPLLDQHGRAFRLAELRGRPLVVSFVYTGCFQVCPTTTRFLKDAVAQARAALGPQSFRVLTIGFNQPFDTPEAMADFARRQVIDDPDWRFAAPRAEDVPALLARFGLSVERSAGGFEHVIQVSIVDAEGVLHSQVYGDGFELPMFIGPIKELLSGAASRKLTLESVWTKVKLYCTVYDPSSGRYRLDYSLFVELFAGITFLGAVIAFLLRELRRGRAA